MREGLFFSVDKRLTGLTLTKAALDCSEKEEDLEDSGVDFLESSFLLLDGLLFTDGAPCLGRLYLMSQFMRRSNCSDGSSER